MNPVSLFVLSLLPFLVTSACTHKDDIVKYGMVETLLLADIIVYGKYLGTGNGTLPRVQVYCILKGPGIDMPENITTRYPDPQCSPTEMTEGERYVIMMNQEGLSDKDTFRLYEHSQSTSAAIEATPQNLNKTVNVCNIKESGIRKPVDASTNIDCPKRTVTDDNCIKTDDTSGARKNTYPLLLLLLTMAEAVYKLHL